MKLYRTSIYPPAGNNCAYIEVLWSDGVRNHKTRWDASCSEDAATYMAQALPQEIFALCAEDLQRFATKLERIVLDETHVLW